MQNRAKIYTVSQVNSLIKEILENNLPSRLTITGEITNWSIARSGHAYFGLKDENALLPSVCWRSSLSKIKFEPENGLAVIAKGHIEVYSPHGKYQFYADSMQPAGVGALHLAFEQMVKRLREQGLFDDAHKKTLPAYPQRIAILTSESGAAVHDIQDSIHNRWPPAKLFLYPVPVQGEGAAEQIAEAIRDVNRRNKNLKLDTLIVGRGGGSLEDLWAFNEEPLAKAIFDSIIPVISAVGHEIDTTIADFVADARASTPTKAGVVAVPDMLDVLENIDNLKERLKSHIKFMVHSSQQQSDELCFRLQSSVKHLLVDTRNTLYEIAEQIRQIEPHRLLAGKTLDLNDLQNQAKAALKAIINNSKMQLTAQTNRLAALNPKSILQRGYSITTNKKTGSLIRRLEDVQIGDKLKTELADENYIESKVTKK
ncbi:MAG: exodeoxyribonuclease VII large subunit [Planctomycetota bacterium]|jgi:exodeoxyribonuclease VII large subunit